MVSLKAIPILFLLAISVNATYLYSWDNSTALYRQVFDINYSKMDSILNYQARISLNTTSVYNSTLASCNFIAAWHPGGQATPVWVPTFVAPDRCNNLYWNTTVNVKLPTLGNTNGTLALYFGLPFDGTLTYANNSGNDTFMLYDNGSTVAGASLNANLTDAASVFYPGRWNITAAYSAANNVTYANGEINVLKSTPNGRRTIFSTNYNLTDDLIIDYKYRLTGTCNGDSTDGETNILAGWGGYYNKGIPGIDSSDSGVSLSLGPGDGTDPHFLNNAVTALFMKINNWSTTGAKVTNMWVNLTGKWPVANGLKPQTTGNPNYATVVVASENATEVYSQLNGTTYANISATNYCIDGTGGCGNTTVWRTPFQAQYNGTLSPATQNMQGRLMFDQREVCSGGTENVAIDDLQVSKYAPNMTIEPPALLGLQGQPPVPTPTAVPTVVPTPIDFLGSFQTTAAPQFLNIFGDPIIAGITILAVAGAFIVFGGLGFQAGGAILFMLTYVLADEGLLPIPVYIIMLLAVAYVLFALIMRVYRR